MPELLEVKRTRRHVLALHGLQSRNILRARAHPTLLARCTDPRIPRQSRECQKAAWPTHKTKCRLNTRAEQLPAGMLSLVDAKLKALRAFTSKHRPTLCECGIRALELGISLANCEHEFLLVRVRERPGWKKAELSFVVEGTGPARYDWLAPQLAAEMQVVRRQADESNKRTGMAGTFFVVLLDVETGIRNNAPVGFTQDSTYPKPIPYKEMLLDFLNNGRTW